MTRRRKWSLGTILAAALMTAAFVAGECGGYVHMESTAFLRVYNDSSRPMLNILFDPLVTDWNAYQARELSYLVDCLDARFIYFCRHSLTFRGFLFFLFFCSSGFAFLTNLIKIFLFLSLKFCILTIFCIVKKTI